MSLTKRDRKLLWHPFTQEKSAPDPIVITRGQGSYVYDEQGKAYLDLISSWWVNLHGHARPKIAQAIYKQALRLEQVIFAGFTHEPAVTLCENLQEILPPELSRFFFSDNGSTAVEVALKMAYQYWQNQGQERKLFLSFEGGYHGDTFGAMATGYKSGFHDAFSALFFPVISLPYPEAWDDDQEIEIKEQQALTKLKQCLKKNGDKIAAIIVEPLVQGASGMRFCRAQFLQRVVDLVKEHKILIIFDEVMTGFGRTGNYFALSKLSIAPDILCLSKGLTGGFLPLALTIVKENIYRAFLSDKWQSALAHGHSYTANPIACSAAICSLKLLKSPSCQNAIKIINQSHCHGISWLKTNCPKIEKSRVLGTISAFALKKEFPVTPALRSQFFEAGLLLRPLGNTIYLLPPYSTTADELKQGYRKITEIFCHCP